MTRAQALAELIAKVEAGGDLQFADVECCFIGPDTTQYPASVDYVIHAFRGSLNAALALHQAVLPGWHWQVWGNGAEVWEKSGDNGDDPVCAASPARAWLLAILKALHAQEQEITQ